MICPITITTYLPTVVASPTSIAQTTTTSIAQTTTTSIAQTTTTSVTPTTACATSGSIIDRHYNLMNTFCRYNLYQKCT